MSNGRGRSCVGSNELRSSGYAAVRGLLLSYLAASHCFDPERVIMPRWPGGRGQTPTVPLLGPLAFSLK